MRHESKAARLDRAIRSKLEIFRRIRDKYAMVVGKFGLDAKDTSGFGARCVGIWRILERPNVISETRVGLWTVFRS